MTLKKNKHHSPILQNYWNKYGEDAFSFKIIEEIFEDEQLLVREQYYIDSLNPKFNCSKTAGSPLGVKHTLQSRINMSNAHKNMTNEQRGHVKECKCFICFRPKTEDSPRYIKREERICFCGCDKTFVCMINSKKKFISGHNRSQKGKKKTKETIEKQRNSLLKTLRLKKLIKN